MNNDMLDVFFYLENHLDWKVKVNYYIRSLSSFCEKTGVFSLKFVNVGESITVTLADVSMELEFFGPNSFIKTLEISCQEGFFIKIFPEHFLYAKSNKKFSKSKKMWANN